MRKKERLNNKAVRPPQPPPVPAAQMPSINDAWVKKPKKPKGIAKSSHTMKVRYHDILFKNMPSFEHVPHAKRKRCQELHVMWESELAATSTATLHYSLTGKASKYGMPRQTVAYLIAEYCRKRHVAHETLVQSITNANGAVDDPGLISAREGDNKAVFNLHKLSDDALWRVYCSIPVDARPAERPAGRPVAPPQQRKDKRRKSGRRDADGKLIKKNEAPPAAPVPQALVEQEIVWACCDGCDKWRRVPGVASESDLPSPWYCEMHPGSITCDTCEDAMDADEKWTGESTGVKFEDPPELDADTGATSSGQASAHASDREGEEGEGTSSVAEVAPTGGFAMAGQVEEDDDDDVENLFGSEDSDGEF